MHTQNGLCITWIWNTSSLLCPLDSACSAYFLPSSFFTSFSPFYVYWCSHKNINYLFAYLSLKKFNFNLCYFRNKVKSWKEKKTKQYCRIGQFLSILILDTWFCLPLIEPMTSGHIVAVTLWSKIRLNGLLSSKINESVTSYIIYWIRPCKEDILTYLYSVNKRQDELFLFLSTKNQVGSLPQQASPFKGKVIS